METKVVPYNYIDDLEEEMKASKGSVVGIEQMSITYVQPADTCSSSEEAQTLTLTTQQGISAGKEDAERKESFYFNITIPDGQHWSVDKGDSLVSLIEDFKQRIYLTTTHNPESNGKEGKPTEPILLEEQGEDTGAPEGV